MRPLLGAAMLAVMWATTAETAAQDTENCLSCHRFRGLSRLDKQSGELRLFFCSAEYYYYHQGPHARLSCTDCHAREEVVRIPHEVRTPVDCARTCHLDSATGMPIRFSHAPAAHSLEHSVHAPDVLAKLHFDPPLLRPGQSACLYCHDEPVFRQQRASAPGPTLSPSTTERCDSCHRVQIPIPVEYFANHVASRFEQFRPIKQLAQVCAVCHSDPAILAQMDGGGGQVHDAVASYLHSFHGKAKLLGSEDTATCVNCHASETGDIHAMQSHRDPTSTTHAANLPDTCRSVECHPGAAPGMTQAAVHLKLSPGDMSPEYLVAAAFVLMTAAVMLVFFALIMLELINAAVRRRDPEHERLVALARRLQKTPEGQELLARTTPHQRVQHWLLAGSFALLVATGMPIKFADAAWASGLVSMMGGLTVARFLHRVCGVLLIAVFLYHLGYLLAQFLAEWRRERLCVGGRSALRIVLDSPMVITLEDARSFLALFAYLLGLRKHRPKLGRMSFTQKFEYWAVFWGVPVMGVSGFVLWGAPWVTEHVSGRALNFAFIIHSDEAYLAFIYIAVVHIFTVMLAPVVFPMSLGTLSGQAPAAELAEQHAAQLEEVARKLNIRVDPPPAPRGLTNLAVQTVRRGYAAALCGLCAMICFVSMRFLVTMVLGHEAAPVEITQIPKRLDMASLTQAGVFSPLARGDRPRAPLAHFHQIPDWFRADMGNNCTTAGCHAPLPHGDRIEVRAFLNMHATFVDCAVCHVPRDETMQAHWFDLERREPSEPPAVLQIAVLLESPEATPDADQAALGEALQRLLERALREVGENDQLRDWLVRLRTSHPTSRVRRATVEDMRRAIVLHVHGEYAARIGLYIGDRLVGEPDAAQREATRRYLAQRGRLTAAQEKELLDRVHAGLELSGAMCTPCHTPAPTLIDAAALGYPASRMEALRGSTIVRQVLAIERGQPFFIPLPEPREEGQ